MDMVTLMLFVALEAAILLGVAVTFLWRRNRQLQQRVNELATAPAAETPLFASIESGYLPYLEQELIETRAQLEQTEQAADDDEDLAAALRCRADFLDAEKKVIELCNDHPKQRWQHVAGHFRPPSQETEVEAVPEPAGDEAPGQGGDMGELQALYAQQGDSIQSLRDVIRQVKADPRAELVEQLEQKISELERHYREANTCLEIMDQENARLQDKVERKDQYLDNMKKDNNETVTDLEEQLGRQKRSISELHHMLDDLQLEADKARELQDKLDQFDLASRDMNMCIQVLEEENEFLQDQVRGLLQLEDGDSVYQKKELEQKLATAEQQLEELSARLAEKEQQLQEREAQPG